MKKLIVAMAIAIATQSASLAIANEEANPQNPQSTILDVIVNSMNSGKMTRRVLYTCPESERFYCFEHLSNVKVKGTKYACVTENKITGEQTLVVNGKTVVTAPNLTVHWIDLSSKGRNIYSYSPAQNKEYLSVDGKLYGPYESISYEIYGNERYYDGSWNLDLLYKRNFFNFTNMGKHYRHDCDGTIYECQSPFGFESRKYFEENPVFRTKSGSHEAKFSNNFHSITVDGKTYSLPLAPEVKIENYHTPGFILTDYGACLFSLHWNVGNEHKICDFVIDNGKLTQLGKEEYFDPVARKIKIINDSENESYEEQLHLKLGWDSNDGMQNAFETSLRDKTKKHLFTADWRYDYVTIDGKKYGDVAPLNAFYDEENNAFGWTAIEGRKLVLYSYQL